MKTLLSLLLCSALPALSAGFFGGQQAALSAAPVVNRGKSPLEISVSCLQFLRAEKLRENGVSDGAAVGASGSTAWEDEAGSNDATQGTAAARPTLIYNAYNGKACVRFDGGGDYLGHLGVASKACWAVLKATSYPISVAYLCGSSGTGGFWVDSDNGGGADRGLGWYNGGALERAANASNLVSEGGLHTLVWTATQLFIDGVEVTGYANTGTVTGATITSLGISSHFVVYWPFDLVEIAHLNGTPTSTDIADMHAYAVYTYGAPE